MYSTRQNTAYLIKNMWLWDKPLFVLSSLQAPLLIGTAFIGIWLPKAILDTALNSGTVRSMLLQLLLPLVLLLLASVAKTAIKQWCYLRKITYRMKYALLLSEKALSTDFENIDGAEGQERFSLAQEAVQSNSSGPERMVEVATSLLSNGIGFILYSGIILTLHPLLVGFIILSAIMNFSGGLRVNRYVNQNKEAISDIRRKLNYIARTGGSFQTAKDLKLYNTSPWFVDNFKLFLESRFHIAFKNDQKRYALRVLDGLLIFIRDGLTYGFLIYAVLTQGLSIGNFALYFGAVAGLSGWLTGIVTDLKELDALSLETNHLRAYLEMKDKEAPIDEMAIPSEDTWPCDIEFVNVSFKYPKAEKATIKNFNLHIRRGEKCALVGVNGAGKTTLVKLMTGLYEPTEGIIKVNGIDRNRFEREAYFKLFSVVFQDHYVLPMTIEENVALKEKRTMSEVESQRVLHVLELAGLGDKLKRLKDGKNSRLVKSVYEDAIEFSGGEYQKLMLAQALYKNAPIMILDEPTAALDPIAENKIYKQYNALTKAHTSLFISHRLSSTRFCDRIVFLEDGQIVEMGTHADLMQYDSKYKAMFDKQSHYYKEGVVESA